MTSMVEKVADAIADNIEAALMIGVTIDYEYAARAAIEAMREPTEEVTYRAFLDVRNVTHSEAWQRMIDAALHEKPSLLPPQSEE